MSHDNNSDINVSITFRHTESTPALKSYAIEKATHCLQKYINDPAELHIILNVEKRDHIAEAILRSKVYDISAKAVTENLYPAIDKVVDTMDVQIRKQKDRLISHK